ncbi:MAG: hypothetical protein H0T60_07495, partial [Acidobacteria bacterium]|nr:hypothetical protein [Acidobacteriota bacterium]
DIFFSTSLEWSRIFNAILAGSGGGMGGSVIVGGYMVGMGGDESEEAPVPAEAIIESIEKLFGFKFKEELLPSLGNEIAVSVPLASLSGPGSYESELEAAERAEKGGKEAKEAKDGAAGLVVLVALNDAEKVKKILPRVAMAFGFAAPGATAQTERREGFDIQTLGGFSYVFINNHLAAAQNLKAVRHVVDAYARRQTLDATNSFRDATAWQARQRIAQVYVSEALMKSTQEDAKKMASVSSDPLVLGLISQLNTPPEPASYAATNEGDMVLHEVRFPLGFIKSYVASAMIAVKEAPIMSNESMARYALGAVTEAQERFKVEKKQQRFATLEELLAAGLIEKWVFERQEYKIELTVVGEKFEATATPLNYGKTGRRSFFVDESGIVRAADHQGKPATAQDPPVD